MLRRDAVAAGDDPIASAHAKALEALTRLQKPNGAFAGEVVWNPMLVCQWVMLHEVLGRPIPAKRRARVLLNLDVQRRADGGWGMHPDSESWLFHTTLAYVAMRLLEVPADDPRCTTARAWIQTHGGPAQLPTWGRIWLALLGLYPWRHVQPILPEMWLLPDAAPMHPRRLYCHMRLIYLGLSWLQGRRVTAPRSPRLDAIAEELWGPGGVDERLAAREANTIASTDLYEGPGRELQLAFAALRGLDRVAFRFAKRSLRARALERALEHIRFEFESTNDVCLSPVNGMLFTLALHDHDPGDPAIERALAGIEYWMWEDDVEGLRIAGARSDIWDTSFLIQALAEAPRSERAAAIAARAATWLESAQMKADVPGGDRHYRAPARGGWGFADEHHPWPVSDCTAEALEALMHLQHAEHAWRGEDDARTGASSAGLRGATRLGVSDALAAIEFVLQRQNDDGGFGSYEARRGGLWLGAYNPAEIYGNCMLELSYTECTASCVKGIAVALAELGDAVPSDLRARAVVAIERGRDLLLSAQDACGGWAGFWGVHFTYGTYFAVHGLSAAGIDPQHPAIHRAVAMLLARQRSDGGWAEHPRGLLDGRESWIDPDATLCGPSSAVQTAWAVLTLQVARPSGGASEEHELAIARGVAFLADRQQTDGTWPKEPATGVFFNTAVLEYRLYRQIFPFWALSRERSFQAASGASR